MKRIFLIFSLFTQVLASTTFAQDYFTPPRERTIERMGGGGVGAITIGKPMVYIYFTPSPAGQLMWIEDLDPLHAYSFGETYSDFTGNRKANYLRKHGPHYDSERIVKRLHITDSQGKDQQVIPIADKHGDFYDETGRFKNSKMVTFHLLPRHGGIDTFHVFDLTKMKVFTWKTSADFKLVSEAEVAPDGINFAVRTSNLKGDYEFAYYNDRLVLPYFDDHPPLPTISPEEYQNSLARMREKLKAWPGGFQFSWDPRGMWSEDGRYLALVQGQSNDGGTSATVSHKPSVLIVDLQKTGPGKDYRDYALRIPVAVPLGALRRLEERAEIFGEPGKPVPSPYAMLHAYFRERENKVLLRMEPNDTNVDLEVPLPRDWRKVTIRQRLGVSSKH